jgi:CheY-like chemotaxis protein
LPLVPALRSRQSICMRILLADDNAELRAALRLLLEELGEPDMIEAGDEQELLSLAEQGNVDVILLDWELPEGSVGNHDNAAWQGRPAELVQELKRTCPRARVIAMSCRPEAEKLSRLAGCDGFVSRNEPPDRLLAVLQIADRR